MNAGLRQCRAAIVARMDPDDVMLPPRLDRQLAYLAEHPEVDILGAQIEVFDDATGKSLRRTNHAAVVTDELIDGQASARNIWFLNHPTVMFRKASLERIGGYPEQYRYAEDLACWLTARRAGLVIHNLPEVLVRYRHHPAQIGSRPETVRQRVAIVRALTAEWTIKKPLQMGAEHLQGQKR
ncbi:MAG: glycosyltransferase [Thermoguttaceae bacterium]